MTTPEPRWWTVDEARSELPTVRAALETLQRHVMPIPGTVPPSDEAARHSLQLLHDRDIVLRDPATGLIDFWAKSPTGEGYFLCFRLDDDDLGWWHRVNEGFAARKPLPRPAVRGPEQGGDRA